MTAGERVWIATPGAATRELTLLEQVAQVDEGGVGA